MKIVNVWFKGIAKTESPLIRWLIQKTDTCTISGCMHFIRVENRFSQGRREGILDIIKIQGYPYGELVVKLIGNRYICFRNAQF